MRDFIVCPKCRRERRPGEEACARCGLVVTRWSTFVATVSSHPLVDTEWQRLRENWEDDAAHRRFLERTASVDALDLAAAHYREELREHPTSTRAQAGLRRAASLAESLYSQKAQAERAHAMPSLWFRLVGYLFGGLIMLAFLWSLTFFFHRR